MQQPPRAWLKNGQVSWLHAFRFSASASAGRAPTVSKVPCMDVAQSAAAVHTQPATILRKHTAQRVRQPTAPVSLRCEARNTGASSAINAGACSRLLPLWTAWEAVQARRTDGLVNVAARPQERRPAGAQDAGARGVQQAPLAVDERAAQAGLVGVDGLHLGRQPLDLPGPRRAGAFSVLPTAARRLLHTRSLLPCMYSTLRCSAVYTP